MGTAGRALTRLLPTMPVAPVTKTFTARRFLHWVGRSVRSVYSISQAAQGGCVALSVAISHDRLLVAAWLGMFCFAGAPAKWRPWRSVSFRDAGALGAVLARKSQRPKSPRRRDASAARRRQRAVDTAEGSAPSCSGSLLARVWPMRKSRPS
jgi:hypothetical protein